MEVLRVSPWQKKVTLNASARANIQSGTVTATPLTDAGLDGTGEIIQVGGWLLLLLLLLLLLMLLLMMFSHY